jgi:hypothetical protein
MDRATRYSLQAIVAGLHRGGIVTDEVMTGIIEQLHEAADSRHRALDAECARHITVLANAIEAEAELG